MKLFTLFLALNYFNSVQPDSVKTYVIDTVVTERHIWGAKIRDTTFVYRERYIYIQQQEVINKLDAILNKLEEQQQIKK